MEESLKMRIELLNISGQVSKEVFECLPSLFEEIENYKQVQLREENGASLVTHISIALERIKNNTYSELITDELNDVIQKNWKDFEFAKYLLEKYANRPFSDALVPEAGFIALYLTILSK